MTRDEKEQIFAAAWRVYVVTGSSFSAGAAAEDFARKSELNVKEAISIAYRAMAKYDSIVIESKTLHLESDTISDFFHEVFDVDEV